MSYGGSSLIIMCVATAMMLRVYHEATAPEGNVRQAPVATTRLAEEAV